ncbi:hypothetical protein BDZ89DRAFT_512851 [Hymenopellis radicata]|nr:hypothetical protein BDZ89DRAFT_512851 [Hymenopellis radicata]
MINGRACLCLFWERLTKEDNKKAAVAVSYAIAGVATAAGAAAVVAATSSQARRASICHPAQSQEERIAPLD